MLSISSLSLEAPHSLVSCLLVRSPGSQQGFAVLGSTHFPRSTLFPALDSRPTGSGGWHSQHWAYLTNSNSHCLSVVSQVCNTQCPLLRMLKRFLRVLGSQSKYYFLWESFLDIPHPTSHSPPKLSQSSFTVLSSPYRNT